MADSSFPPSGIDRADGIDGQPGTPTPVGARQIQPSPSFFEELPDSPEIEIGEHLTFVHRFKTDYNNAIEILNGNPRGTVLLDSSGNQSKVLTAQLTYQKGDYCIVSITAEGTQYSPEDEYDVEVVEFNPSIFLHPRYKSVVNYTPTTGINMGLNIGPQIISAITNAANSPSFQQTQDQSGFLEYLITGTGDNAKGVLALSIELVTKLNRGEDTFYLAGWRVSWSQYCFLPPGPRSPVVGISPGGYLEDPVYQGALPSYFWSDNGTPSGNNTLIALANEVNPTIYPAPADGNITFSWMRQADHLTYQRVWFKITRSWVGGPLGTWDKDIYPPSMSPTTGP